MGANEIVIRRALEFESATLAVADALKDIDRKIQLKALVRWSEAVAVVYALPIDERLQGEAFLAARGKIRDLDWHRIQAALAWFAAEADKATTPDQLNVNNEE